MPTTEQERNETGISGMSLEHVVESQQFTVPLLMELFDRSLLMERIVARGGTLDYQNRILASLFYQPSTRTRFSFEAAMHRLGGRVLSTEHARAFSSEIDAEQVEDSIRIIGSYCDVIVIRHHQAGGAARAAKSLLCRSSMPATAMAASIPLKLCSISTPSIGSGLSTASA
jgi:aspartate carbamoyltransferase catalytic subunit